MGLISLIGRRNISSGFSHFSLNSVQLGRTTASDTRRRSTIMGKKGKDGAGTGAGGEATLRHIKYREKIGGKLPVPGFIQLIAVGNGGGGSPRGLIVHMSHFKYLFNCGEGLQRISSEHKMKLSRIEQIFLTHSSWDNVGGLMGLCLTMESAGVPTVTLHGPPKVESIVSSARTFAQLRSLQLVKRDMDDGEYEDSAMKVEYIPIFPSSDLMLTEQPQAKKQRLSGRGLEEDIAVAYVCKPHPRPRAVSLEMLAERDIPVGPHLSLLKDGQEVVLPDGRLVKPDDVLSPAEVADPFLVVECPTEAHLNGLVTNAGLMKYEPNVAGSEAVSLSLIVHFTPDSVMQTSAYQEWMKRFNSGTKHLILNEMGSDVASEAIYEIQAKLNLIHPQIFPLLPHQRPSNEVDCVLQKDTESLIYGKTNLKYSYRGKEAKEFSWQDCVKLDNGVFIKEVMESSEFTENLKAVRQTLLDQDASGAVSEYPEILFLGTGSAIPNKVRNVSAIWINMTNDSSILLDCGEDTYGQLYRNYATVTPEMLRRLKAVFVSHLHADHHLGIVGLALARYRCLSPQSAFEPLTVLAPGAICNWYKTLHSRAIPMLDLVRVIPVENFYPSNRNQYESVYCKLLSDLNLKGLSPVRVLHRQFPHGLVLIHTSGWKLVYSGDTMPSPELIQAGDGCDLLIHEATMEDFLAEDAKDKRHSTTSQAIEVGVKMNAKFILLTHFSQRYAKVPVFNDSFSSQVGTAFDNMKVRLGDLKLLPLFVPSLKSMFADEYLELEEKTEKRRRQKHMEQFQEKQLQSQRE